MLYPQQNNIRNKLDLSGVSLMEFDLHSFAYLCVLCIFASKTLLVKRHNDAN